LYDGHSRQYPNPEESDIHEKARAMENTSEEIGSTAIAEQIRKSFHRHFPDSSEIAQAFAKTCKIKKYDKGEIIKKSGHSEDYFSVIVSGCAGIFVTSEKRIVCLDICLENDFLVEYESFITASASEGYTQALEALVIARVPVPRKGCYAPEGMESLIRVASNAMFLDRQARLVSMLTETPLERFQKVQSHYPELPNRVSVTILASWLGITREHLSRLRGMK
jgi:CRP-like cAMP-binding protein